MTVELCACVRARDSSRETLLSTLVGVRLNNCLVVTGYYDQSLSPLTSVAHREPAWLVPGDAPQRLRMKSFAPSSRGRYI
jgi:hypothetical protein